ncbi:uncharacterized protein LOC121420941 [Lytechinus variegatus]|uniref:uncharacterized protein LOC121420941 n=1 Tax=Lytechinus variegatus TaxID=7654 RepID=UPI001BB1B253|nr:uncharacterized protein LOC121420941 [Lytechinus variegatus]
MADVAVRNYRMSHHGHQRQKSEKQNYSYRSGRGNPCAQKYQRKNPNWRGQNRPTFVRLDSTGENSGSSCEDLNGAISPEIQQASNHCQPRFQSQDNKFTCTRQGVGLLDKVKSALGASNQTWHPPRRETTRNLMQSQGTLSNSPDSHLATLDSVAEKLTNMSMPKHPPHWGNPMANSQQSSQMGPPRHNAQGQWGRTFVPQDRGHAPIFHPYQGMNQSPFLASTQNYQRNLYSNPWHQMMGGNNQRHPPYHQGFHHFAPPPPPFPWQQLLGPQMMQGFAHQGPMNRNQRARSPPKKPKWNNGHGNRQRTFPQSKPKSQSRWHADHSSSSVTSSSETCVQISSQIRSCIDKTVVHVQINTSEVKSDETLVTADCGSEEFIGHVVDSSAIISPERTEDLVKTSQAEERIANFSDLSKSNTSCLMVKADEENVAVQNENCQTTNERKDGSKKNEESDFNERHSSIELILADYKVQSSTQDKEMALSSSSDPESGSDSDSAVEANADLWESFTASDDPYNPLCGWRCNDSIQEGHPGTKLSFQECHIDSGTDEGDNWSETDSDDDYDSGDDSPVDDVDTSLPRSFKLSDPQLQELRDSLSSTPKEKPDSASGHHPSVAFILGSTSSSSDDDDDDDDWDTLDDPSTLEDDPLWDSFNRPRDPYSPMEAWKCHDSNLSSSVPSPSPSTPLRKDSVEGLRTLLLASTEQKETLPRICEGLPSRESDIEIFDIATIRVHGARDDIDLGSPTVAEGSMKRVASASCLRRYQLTPQDKASKKVRFCPDSSFIVLVEKDPASCETNPTHASENDWQACARDRMRFKARIDQLSRVLDPVLTNTHREQVYTSRMAEGEDR